MSTFKFLYVMISRTDTGVGRVIRTISRYPYNHVSLTLDPSFRNWVSFARFKKDAPLYSGFTVEPIERFFEKGHDVKACIFRIPISQQKFEQLTALFAKAGEKNDEFIYNTFDILAAIFGCKVRISGAYTCLGFACSVLNKQFITIKALAKHLQPYKIYEGPLCALVADSGKRDDSYFQKLGWLKATKRSARHLAILCARAYNDAVARQ